MKEQKYIFITGGVLSSLGKGITSASIALLLENQGWSVFLLKMDPYLNRDPGTMNPFQHGEVYVTDDGTESDMDLGHYFRFSHSPLSALSTVTSGKIYHKVLQKERRGEYLGETVQVIPHVTREIQEHILSCSVSYRQCDFFLIEIGGTVGDIESLPFLEAMRQFREKRVNDSLHIHLTYVPLLHGAGEMKSKPTQQSVQILRGLGLVPDLMICRSECSISHSVREKIHLFCTVNREYVIDLPDVSHSIYEVPLLLYRQKLDEKLCSLLQFPYQKRDLHVWEKVVHRLKSLRTSLPIALVGKYSQHADAYRSILEALTHAGIVHDCAVEVIQIDVEKMDTESTLQELFTDRCQGCILPGGFGKRGWEEKIQTVHFCRLHKIPFLGICLGMQALLVEYARHVLGLTDANSTEITQTSSPIISLMEEQKKMSEMGGSMRLGAYPCVISSPSKAFESYRKREIHERHRHRYEFSHLLYRELFEASGVLFSGEHEASGLVEITEIPDHPWMIGVQFHPEFLSKPDSPHPLFVEFLRQSLK